MPSRHGTLGRLEVFVNIRQGSVPVKRRSVIVYTDRCWSDRHAEFKNAVHALRCNHRALFTLTSDSAVAAVRVITA
jgi:hypothetical protein